MQNFKSFTHLLYHKSLNPVFFHNNKLKEVIRQHLLTIGHVWQEYAKIPDDAVIDYLMTGGNTQRNYSSVSDIDLHLLVDPSKMPIKDPDMMHDYIMAKKDLWAVRHKGLNIKGAPVEIYAQSIEEPVPEGQSAYSLFNNNWLREGENLHLRFNIPEIRKPIDDFVKQIDAIIQTNDLEGAKALKDKIVSYRKLGLAAEGEFSPHNQVFKGIRASGYLEKLSDFITNLEDRNLSY